MRYYIVSDVHAFYDQMITSLTEEGFFADHEPHKLVILGDFFDRGLKAKEMQKFLIDEINKNEVILIKGNHEDLIKEFIEHIDNYLPNLPESHHFRNSTVDTVCQLTDSSLNDIYENKQMVVKLMKDTPLFKTIIPSCLDYYETKHFIFTHGFIPMIASEYGTDGKFEEDPNWRRASNERWYYARWYNGMNANRFLEHKDKTIVIGHWHASWGHCNIDHSSPEYGENADYSPFYGDHLICIDGCVPRSNHVNCLVIEDEEL